MAVKSIFAILFFLSGLTAQARRLKQGFDKSAFYNVMASGDTVDINNELILVMAALIPEKEAYKGALLMKKAGLLTKPAAKLKSFKAGCIKLETAIKKDSTNGEYHFLRLSIQEHAPKVVRYFKDLEHDRHIIQRTFKELLPEVQKAIKDYTKNSRILHPEDIDPKN